MLLGCTLTELLQYAWHCAKIIPKDKNVIDREAYLLFSLQIVKFLVLEQSYLYKQQVFFLLFS